MELMERVRWKHPISQLQDTTYPRSTPWTKSSGAVQPRSPASWSPTTNCLLPNPSQFTFLLSLLPVLRIACLLWSHWASWRSYLCYFLPFYQLLSSFPPQPIFSSLHLAFTSSRLKLTPIKKNHSNFKTFALAHWNFIIIVLHCIPKSLLWQPVYKFYHSKISVFCLLL